MKYHHVMAQVKFDVEMAVPGSTLRAAQEQVMETIKARLSTVFSWEEMSWLTLTPYQSPFTDELEHGQAQLFNAVTEEVPSE